MCLNLRDVFSEKLEQMLFAGSLLPPMSCLFKNLRESFLACRMDFVQVAEQYSVVDAQFRVLVCHTYLFFCVSLRTSVLHLCLCDCIVEEL